LDNLWVLVLGVVAVLLSAAQALYIWFEEKGHSGKPSWLKLAFLVATAIVGIGSLVISSVSQVKSNAAAKAAQNNLTDAIQTAAAQEIKLGEENQKLRALLSGNSNEMTTLGGQLQANEKAMHPERAQLEITMTDGRNRLWLHELTSVTDGKEGAVILMVRNPTSVNALDGNLMITFCKGCRPIVNYPTNEMLTVPFKMISGGGHMVETLTEHFTIPPGTREIPIEVMYECATCIGDPHPQRLKLHLVYSPNAHFTTSN
jgi:hypothetical protein